MPSTDKRLQELREEAYTERPGLRNNVPERPTYFVGREEVVADLVASLTTPRAPDLAIAGPPGVGKTALATELAHHPAVLAHFPDGVYWISLGANPDVAYIQAQWAAALGHDIGDEPDIERRRARINTVIGRRRMLIVFDDVWDLTPAYLLHSAGPNTVHVLTTRNHTMAVTFAGNERAFAVGALDTAAAFTLLGALAPRATNARPAQAQVLAARVGGLPLAIGLLGGDLAEQPRSWFPEVDQAKLDELASPQDRLALAETRLEADVDQESVLDQVIHLHLDDLGQLAPQAAEALNCLGAFAPEPATFDQAAAMAVGACSADTLRLLAARSLLKAGIDDKLMLHPVVADYIAGHVPPAAVSRHQTHYWGMVTAAGKDWQIIDAIFDQISHAMPPRLDDPMRLVAWVQALGPYLRRRGITDAYLAWAQQALALARQVSDKVGEATMLNNIGGIYVDFGDNLAQANDPKTRTLQEERDELSSDCRNGLYTPYTLHPRCFLLSSAAQSPLPHVKFKRPCP